MAIKMAKAMRNPGHNPGYNASGSRNISDDNIEGTHFLLDANPVHYHEVLLSGSLAY